MTATDDNGQVWPDQPTPATEPTSTVELYCDWRTRPGYTCGEPISTGLSTLGDARASVDHLGWTYVTTSAGMTRDFCPGHTEAHRIAQANA